MIRAPPPIPTAYRGVLYRSRLEARWACFLDELGVVFVYEEEGFDLDGTWYLPDFKLRDMKCWLEIKPERGGWLGNEPTTEEAKKACLLAEATGEPVYMFFGMFCRRCARSPRSEGYVCEVPEGHLYSPGARKEPVGGGRGTYWEWTDNGCRWCRCFSCGAVGIEFEGRSGRLPCKGTICPKPDDWNDERSYDHPALVAAYDKACTKVRWEPGVE